MQSNMNFFCLTHALYYKLYVNYFSSIPIDLQMQVRQYSLHSIKSNNLTILNFRRSILSRRRALTIKLTFRLNDIGYRDEERSWVHSCGCDWGHRIRSPGRKSFIWLAISMRNATKLAARLLLFDFFAGCKMVATERHSMPMQLYSPGCFARRSQQ